MVAAEVEENSEFSAFESALFDKSDFDSPVFDCNSGAASGSGFFWSPARLKSEVLCLNKPAGLSVFSGGDPFKSCSF